MDRVKTTQLNHSYYYGYLDNGLYLMDTSQSGLYP